MKIGSNKYSNTKFGMALYMPKASKIEKVLGKQTAIEAEKARPKLQELAKDTDIYVNIHKRLNLHMTGFELLVTKLTKNPLKRLFAKRNFVTSNVLNYETTEKQMSTLLVEKATELRNVFLKFMNA